MTTAINIFATFLRVLSWLSKFRLAELEAGPLRCGVEVSSPLDDSIERRVLLTNLIARIVLADLEIEWHVHEMNISEIQGEKCKNTFFSNDDFISWENDLVRSNLMHCRCNFWVKKCKINHILNHRLKWFWPEAFYIVSV